VPSALLIQFIEYLLHPKLFYLKHVLGSNSEPLKLFDMWTVSPLVLLLRACARALVAVRGGRGGAPDAMFLKCIDCTNAGHNRGYSRRSVRASPCYACAGA
jgi:hypothetical protein